MPASERSIWLSLSKRIEEVNSFSYQIFSPWVEYNFLNDDGETIALTNSPVNIFSLFSGEVITKEPVSELEWDTTTETNKAIYKGPYIGQAEVSYIITIMDSSTADSQRILSYLYLNGVSVTGMDNVGGSNNAGAAKEIGSIYMTGLVNIKAGDKLELMVKLHSDVSGPKNADLYKVKLLIKPLRIMRSEYLK